jgi:hypothetical protein
MRTVLERGRPGTIGKTQLRVQCKCGFVSWVYETLFMRGNATGCVSCATTGVSRKRNPKIRL